MEIWVSGVLLISLEAVKVSKSVEEKADKETRFETRQAATCIYFTIIWDDCRRMPVGLLVIIRYMTLICLAYFRYKYDILFFFLKFLYPFIILL